MRIYPTADVGHYWEIPSSWSMYCRTPDKSWHREPLQGKRSVPHWCDLKGAKMGLIKNKDLYIKRWPHTRIRLEACLPQYYCVGNRFISLEKFFPVGYKCSYLPLNLSETRAINEFDAERKKQARLKEKEANRLAKDQRIAEQKKKRAKS